MSAKLAPHPPKKKGRNRVNEMPERIGNLFKKSEVLSGKLVSLTDRLSAGYSLYNLIVFMVMILIMMTMMMMMIMILMMTIMVT